MGKFKDVRFQPIVNFGHFWAPLFSLCFQPIMNFGHFGASLAFDLPQCQEPWKWGRRVRVRKNCQGAKNKRKQRKQHMEENQDKQKQNNKERHWVRDKQKSPCFFFGQRRFHKNTAHARLGVCFESCF